MISQAICWQLDCGRKRKSAPSIEPIKAFHSNSFSYGCTHTQVKYELDFLLPHLYQVKYVCIPLDPPPDHCPPKAPRRQRHLGDNTPCALRPSHKGKEELWTEKHSLPSFVRHAAPQKSLEVDGGVKGKALIFPVPKPVRTVSFPRPSKAYH